MTRILLFCSAGMSTSMLVSKMKKAAQAKGIETSIDAFPIAQMDDHLNDVDVVMLGPQVKYMLPKAKEKFDKVGIPVEVISAVDYGMLNGANVLERALKIANK